MKKFLLLVLVLSLTACGGGNDGGSGNGSMYVGKGKFISSGKISDKTDDSVLDDENSLPETTLPNYATWTGDMDTVHTYKMPTTFRGIEYKTSNDGKMTFEIQDGNVVSIKDNIGTNKETDYNHERYFVFYNNTPRHEYNLKNLSVTQLNGLKEQLQTVLTDGTSITLPTDWFVTEFVVDEALSSNDAVKQKIADGIIAKLSSSGIDLTDELKDAVKAKVGEIADSGILHTEYDLREKTLIGSPTQRADKWKLSFADFGYYTEYESGKENGEEFKDRKRFGVYLGAVETAPQVSKPNLVKTDSGIEYTLPVDSVTFNGYAVAAINKYNEQGKLVASTYGFTDNATLVWNIDNRETLTMNFSKGTKPWYDVVAIKNGDNHTITIDNNSTVGKKFDADFRVTDSMKASATNNVFETKYYGGTVDGNYVREATGWVETNMTNSTDGSTLQFDAAFGGK